MIHIHAPQPTTAKIEQIRCFHCESEQPVFVRFFEWYGAYCTCLTCGDAWSDGVMLERPFKRGWRQERIEEAKKYARELGLYPATPPPAATPEGREGE